MPVSRSSHIWLVSLFSLVTHRFQSVTERKFSQSFPISVSLCLSLSSSLSLSLFLSRVFLYLSSWSSTGRFRIVAQTIGLESSPLSSILAKGSLRVLENLVTDTLFDVTIATSMLLFYQQQAVHIYIHLWFFSTFSCSPMFLSAGEPSHAHHNYQERWSQGPASNFIHSTSLHFMKKCIRIIPAR